MTQNKYNVTQEQRRLLPEELLWTAVISRAVRDAQGGSTCRDCVNARSWLGAYRFRADRELACDFAGINEEQLRRWNRDNALINPLRGMYDDKQLDDALVLHRRKRRGRPRKIIGD